jgi:hypothetical protein
MASSVMGPNGEGRTPVIVPVILAVSVALNLALAVVALSRGPGTVNTTTTVASAGIHRDRWYSVFLTNQEAFVGHITDISNSDITMENIFFLTFQAVDANGNPLPNPKPADFQPALCKLGTTGCRQVYLPKDLIHINRQNVEYSAELKPESPIVKAIDDYQKKNPAASPKP